LDPKPPPDRDQRPDKAAGAQRSIGHYLKATRAAQGLTQDQVAAMTRQTPWSLSRAAISAIERGQNFPGLEAMLALSHVLYVDPKELIERARLASSVPVDLTGVSLDELERRAARYFWAGDFRRALSYYDAMAELIVLHPPEDGQSTAERVAALEIKRATALKRVGALSGAIATAERAIALSIDFPRIHAESYIVLADLQCQRGHLPLAEDAAAKAVRLAESLDPQVRGWAFMVRAQVLYMRKEHDAARRAFEEARRQAELGGDERHLTHIDGDIGLCWLAAGRADEARQWIERALDNARRQAQPALEASWLVELGKIALGEGRVDEAEEHASTAIRIAKSRENLLTMFRAEWLRHRIQAAVHPSEQDRHRIARLRKLFLHLDQHEGIEEVQAFKEAVLRARPLAPRSSS